MNAADLKFREVRVSNGTRIKVRGVNGRLMKIRIRQLTENEKAKLKKGLLTICDRLQQPNAMGFDEGSICYAMNAAGFLISRHGGINAYTSGDPEHPFIIFNERSIIWEDPKELAVTLLHELWHMLDTLGAFDGELSQADRLANSKYEAIHDLLCYQMLDFGVPSDHWAFKSFPELKAQCAPDPHIIPRGLKDTVS